MSHTTDLPRLPATELVARIREEESTATESVEGALERIDDRAGVGLHEDLAADTWEWPLTWPFNWTCHPAASAPAGLTDRGHPVGVLLVGRRFEDDTVVAGSSALERERPWKDLYE